MSTPEEQHQANLQKQAEIDQMIADRGVPHEAVVASKAAALAFLIEFDKIPVEAVLKALEDANGFTFGDAVRWFSAKQGEVERKYATTARERYNDEGNMEVDDNAVVSIGADRGAYVMAWKWVDADEAGVTMLEQEQAQVDSNVEPN